MADVLVYVWDGNSITSYGGSVDGGSGLGSGGALENSLWKPLLCC